MFERTKRLGFAALLSALLVSACSASDEPSAGTRPESEPDAAPTTATVTLSESGCAYQGPAEMPVGKVAISLVNETNGQFALDLWLMNEGHAYDELSAHIAEEQRRAEAGEPGLGHPGFATLTGEATAEAGTGGELAGSLAEGTYGLACIRFGPDSVGGIWSAGPFTVANGVTAVTNIGTVTVSANRCTLDVVTGPISTGPMTLTAVNNLDHRTAFHMWRIGEGGTFRDFEAGVAEERRLAEQNKPFIGPPAFATDLIESGLIPAGGSTTMTGDVSPGTWAIVCFRRFEGNPDPFRVFDLVGPIEVE